MALQREEYDKDQIPRCNSPTSNKRVLIKQTYYDVVLVVAMLFLIGCAESNAEPSVTSEQESLKTISKEKPRSEKQNAGRLTNLTDDAVDLKDAFNADAGAARMILLVSPLCPMCRLGAHVVQEKILSQVEDETLKVYVVWLPRFPGDSREVAEKALKLVPDKRARHFWDGEGRLGDRYGKVVDLPGDQEFAWDVYFVFGSKSKWMDEAPPAPEFWMHQLGGKETGNRLDGDELRAVVLKTLP